MSYLRSVEWRICVAFTPLVLRDLRTVVFLSLIVSVVLLRLISFV